MVECKEPHLHHGGCHDGDGLLEEGFHHTPFMGFDLSFLEHH